MIPLLFALFGTAQAADTWIYRNPTYILANDIAPLTTSLNSVGASVTTSTSSTWPTNWSGYKLVIILLPGNSFNSGATAALKSFVDGGGRLVVAGDWSPYTNTENGYANSLFSSLGTGMSLGNNTVAGSGCASTTSVQSDQITDGVGRIYIAASNVVNGGSSLVKYSGNTVAAVAQTSTATSARPAFDTVLVGDVNFFLDDCSGSTTSGNNTTLWQNLYDFCQDTDGDGYTDDACGGDDCDDNDATTYPGAAETPYDGVDDDCDGADLTDVDGDGYAATVVGGTDCDDSDAGVHRGVAETADGVDQNCDGTVDETTSAYDDDGDGYSELGGDCDDSRTSQNPAQPETVNNVDDDCDGTIDDSTAAYDDDGDGFSERDGDCNDDDWRVNPDEAEDFGNGIDDDCDGVADDGSFDADQDGYTSWAGDCNDGDGNTHPGATELPDGKDNNCDGAIDEGTVALDDDGDGYSEAGGDCDDTLATTHPDAAEIDENGVDDNCDGMVDEGGKGSDDDADGYTEIGGDCDDTTASVGPHQAETPANQIDDNCDGIVDEGEFGDADADGVASADGDCDDNNPWVSPTTPEMCDAVDNNCNGRTDEGCEEVEAETIETKRESCGCSTDNGSGAALFLAIAALARRRSGRSGPARR